MFCVTRRTSNVAQKRYSRYRRLADTDNAKAARVTLSCNVTYKAKSCISRLLRGGKLKWVTRLQIVKYVWCRRGVMVSVLALEARARGFESSISFSLPCDIRHVIFNNYNWLISQSESRKLGQSMTTINICSPTRIHSVIAINLLTFNHFRILTAIFLHIKFAKICFSCIHK